MSISIGWSTGSTSQGTSSIALGHTAGNSSQGDNCIAIGSSVGREVAKSTVNDSTLGLTKTNSTSFGQPVVSRYIFCKPETSGGTPVYYQIISLLETFFTKDSYVLGGFSCSFVT